MKSVVTKVTNVSEGLASVTSIPLPNIANAYLLTIVNNLKLVDSPDSNKFTDCVNWAVRRKGLIAHKIMYEIQPSTNKIHCHIIITVSFEKTRFTLQRAIARKFGKGYRTHFQKIKDTNHYKACENYQKFFSDKLNISNHEILIVYDKIRRAKLGICPWCPDNPLHHTQDCKDFTKAEQNEYIQKLKQKILVTFW